MLNNCTYSFPNSFLWLQVKIELPTQLHEKHHLLFYFYHITCDINAKTNAKRKEALETPGELWEVSNQDDCHAFPGFCFSFILIRCLFVCLFVF